MSTVIRELKLALRTARKSPGYSAIAIVTLGLAIGANTLLFSIASPPLVKPLPILDAGRLGWIWQANGPGGISRGATSIADLLDFRSRAKSFTALGGLQESEGTFTGHGDARHVLLNRVTADFCGIWGLHAAQGHLFLPGDDAPGRPLTGVLAYHFWRKDFGGDPAVIGHTFLLDGQSITIVGVMEPEIEIGNLETIDLWAPLPLDASTPRDQRTVRLTGRLAPAVSLESADAEIHGLATELAAQHPATNLNWDAHVVSTREAIVGKNTWMFMALLAVIVGFVLLIACANLANLVLARMVARRHEFAVRLALGASRLQVIRPLLFENTVLGLTGGLFGLAIAQAGLRLVNATAPPTDPYLREIGIDGYVLAFTMGLSLLTPLLFSLWPAITASRAATVETLRDARSSGGRRVRWQRNLLVGSQVALALSLLVVSGLVLQTMRNIHRVQIGMDVAQVFSFRVTLPPNTYIDPAAWSRFSHDAVDALSATPGVASAAASSAMPVFDNDAIRTLSGTPHDGVTDRDRPWAAVLASSPGMFRTVGIRLLAGRTFTASDTAGTEPVALVNQLAAERYFDTAAAAVGRTVTLHDRRAADVRVRVVGVVADTRNAEGYKTSPQIWVPFDQQPTRAMTLIIRADAPDARIRDAAAVMRQIDPSVAISEPRTMVRQVQDGQADDSVLTGLFVGFALLALVLAAGGLYGVISYSVGQRQREIGVRLSLGAAPAAIRRMIMLDGLRVTSAGMAVGLVLACVLAQTTASLLYGISPRDPATFAGVAGLLLLVALAAVWNPARRAMRIDPVKTLRAD